MIWEQSKFFRILPAAATAYNHTEKPPFTLIFKMEVYEYISYFYPSEAGILTANLSILFSK